MKPNNNKYLATVIATTMISTGSATANVLEEIVVTATKRQESVQDIAVSVSALSGDQLNALNLSDMADICLLYTSPSPRDS